MVVPTAQRSRGRAHGRRPSHWAVRGLWLAIRRLWLGLPSLLVLAKLRGQQPDLAAGNKVVREVLAVLKAESKAPEAAAAPATEVKCDWTKNADAALSAAEESTPQPAVGVTPRT